MLFDDIKNKIPEIDDNKLSIDPIKKNFDLFNHFKQDSEYYIQYNNNKIPISRFLCFSKSDKNKITINKKDNHIVFECDDTLLNELNPDLINSKDFWDLAVNNFPLYSMVNANRDIKDIKELKKLSTTYFKLFGFKSELDKIFKLNSYAKVLEIGPGYGNIIDYVDKEYHVDNYYAIDLNYYFYYDRLYKCDGKTIPKQVPKELDMIFSINTFQHLGILQRESYFMDIYKWLKPGGIFLVNMVVVTNVNKTENCWQFLDKSGNYYCKFFNQFTYCDTLENIINKYSKFFDIQVISIISKNSLIIKFKKI